MTSANNLLENNRRWVEKTTQEDPSFFSELAKGQSPPYLWIGCSDSRVPASRVVGLQPGEVFVHRNIANVVSNTDLNALSVLQYAVGVLKIQHVIVCGHYGCGGVAAALGDTPYGLIDNWLRNIKDIYQHSGLAENTDLDDQARLDALCELNVKAQVHNVCHTTIVQDAWRAGQDLTVHGWIKSLSTGLLTDLETDVSGPDQIEAIYRMSGS